MGSHLDECPYCAESNGIAAISDMSGEHQADLMSIFDQMVKAGELTEHQVASIILTLGHHAFKIVRAGSLQDRGAREFTVAEMLQALKAQTVIVGGNHV